ncbi:MAG: membrane protein insertase YidC, partial [Xenophilus sp.]
MNDIRRTILWVIFGFSLVMLWDQWQVYNGRKPTFLPSRQAQQQQPAAPAGQGSASAAPAPAAAAASSPSPGGTAV